MPVIGETFMRLRLPWIERRLFEGGVIDNASLSDALFAEMAGVGNRPGQMEGFISLLREARNGSKQDRAIQGLKSQYSWSTPIMIGRPKRTANVAAS